MALDKGYFKQAGVDVTGILTSKGGGTSVRNMMAGDTLFAEVALAGGAQRASRKASRSRSSAAAPTARARFWVTRPGEKIDTPEDLKGKRFVYSRPEIGEREQHPRRPEVARHQAVAK